MAKTYTSTAAQAGDSEQVLLEKIVQKQGGSLKWGESIRSLLAKLLGLTSTQPKVYRALVSASITGATLSEDTLCENSIGTVTFSKTSDVIHHIEFAGVAEGSRVHVQTTVRQGVLSPGSVALPRLSATNKVTFFGYDKTGTTAEGPFLEGVYVTILVYPPA